MQSRLTIGVAFALVLSCAARGSQATTGSPPQPEPRAAQATSVGAKTCASCHASEHEAWKSGRHSKMIQPAGAAAVVGDFTKTSLTLHGKPYRLRRANGEFFITESSLTGRAQEHRVQFTLGSRRIQHYLTTIDHGRIVVLPPTWDVLRGEWFDNVDIIRPDEADTNLVQQWNKNCVGCHVSQQDNRYSKLTKSYASEWADFGTSCERCHGPGSAHAATYRDAPGGRPAGGGGEAAIVRPTRLAPAAATAVCAQCHSLRDVVAPGFRAGASYDDHFVVKLEYTPRKEQDPVYWADGRPRRFSNDAVGLWQSQCYLKGGATCTSCHDAHLPNVDRHPSLAPTNNALCTTCHQELGQRVATHTKHRAEGPGSSCVECHMPKEVVSIKAKIRDHSIGLPTPENTVAYGIPNACTSCHVTKPATWAVEAMARWWPNGRRAANVERAAAFTAARAGQPDALPKLLTIAADANAGPLTRANALGYLRGYADPRAVQTLSDALRSGLPVERMVAASSLRQPGSRAALLTALDDPQRSVRVSALVSLVNLGGGPFAAEDQTRFRRVSVEFAAQAALHEDDAESQTDLGLVHLLNGEHDQAADALETSLSLEPGRARPTFLLGLVRLGQRRTDDARTLLKSVPASDPYYAAAQERLRRLTVGKP